MLKTVSSFVNVIGALNYKGTWNASTNSPALASGVGTKGDYYVVSVAGTTTLDGESLWGVGDWAAFNGTAWQKVDGGDTGNFTSVVLKGSSTGVNTITTLNSGTSNYTATLPAASTTLPIATQTLTFSGPTAARTVTFPDADFTAARTDAGQTFTGAQVINGAYDANNPSTSSTPILKINEGGAISAWISGKAYTYMWMQAIQDDGSNNPKAIVFNPLGGGVGIGVNPGYQFEVSTDSAAKPSTNTWTIASDARIKTITGEYSKGIDDICALRPVTYRYNGKAGFVDDGKENISIIAQEAATAFPECVGSFKKKLDESDEHETELYNWNGHAITFALINSVKELKAMIDSLKSEIEKLKNP